MSEFIGGVNPVLEALRAGGRTCQRIYLAEGRGGPVVTLILNLARERGAGVRRVERSRLDRMYGRPGHQGVVAEVGSYQYRGWEEIIGRVKGDRGLILVLDGLEDPMNLGSLLRSAEAAGAAGVILPRERSAVVTAAVMKASAGAVEYLPVARVVNLVRTLEELKTQGFWVAGLTAQAETCLYEHDPGPKLALVVGGEGRGLRRLVRETCDVLLSIPLAGRVSSLNAAVAGALAMFEWLRRRGLEAT
ncbi:MAG: 23S rRNA (guanosine(2251)-2'-O)-methyltransferase RlmB [Thermodesulfobacteriota bacterium]